MTVSVDSNLVTTALINVLENSVKVTPEGGDVRLSALATQEELVIQVSDGGPGIPQEDLSKIFDSFYQLDRYGGSKAGLGIGLAIARRVVQTHGGTIWANSGPDGGTVVTITLPR